MIFFDHGLIKVILILNKCSDEPCNKRPIHTVLRRSRREATCIEKQTFIIGSVSEVFFCSLLVKLCKK